MRAITLEAPLSGMGAEPWLRGFRDLPNALAGFIFQRPPDLTMSSRQLAMGVVPVAQALAGFLQFKLRNTGVDTSGATRYPLRMGPITGRFALFLQLQIPGTLPRS